MTTSSLSETSSKRCRIQALPRLVMFELRMVFELHLLALKTYNLLVGIDI